METDGLPSNKPPTPRRQRRAVVDRTSQPLTIYEVRQEVFRALNQEIDRVIRDYQQPGWTRWAMLGALAGAMWLLLNRATAPGLDWTLILQVAVAMLFLQDAWSIIRVLLMSDTHKLSREQRFRRLKVVGAGTRSYLLLEIIRYVLQIAFFVFFAMSVSAAPKVLGSLTSIFAASLLALSLTQTFSWRVTPSDINAVLFRSRVWRIGLFAFVACALSCSALLLHDYFATAVDVATTMPIAALVFAVVHLSLAYALLFNVPAELGSLLEIRRDLAFVKITPDEALRLARFAVDGQRIDDLMQEETAELVSQLRAMDSAVRFIRESVNLTIKELKRNSDATEDQLHLMERSLLAADSHASEFIRLGELLTEAHKRLMNRSAKLRQLSRDTEALDSFVRELSSLINQVYDDYKKQWERLQSVRNRIARLQQGESPPSKVS